MGGVVFREIYAAGRQLLEGILTYVDRSLHNQSSGIDPRICLLRSEQLCGNFRVIRNVNKVHPLNLDTCNSAPCLQHLLHSRANMVAIIDQGYLVLVPIAVASSVTELTTKPAYHVHSLDINECCEVLNVVLGTDGVSDGVAYLCSHLQGRPRFVGNGSTVHNMGPDLKVDLLKFGEATRQPIETLILVNSVNLSKDSDDDSLHWLHDVEGAQPHEEG